MTLTSASLPFTLGLNLPRLGAAMRCLAILENGIDV
jgi:hypothetical protein